MISTSTSRPSLSASTRSLVAITKLSSLTLLAARESCALVEQIKAQAQGSIFQNVSDVYNTSVGHVFTGNLTTETVADLFIDVTSGDGKTTTQYALQILS